MCVCGRGREGQFHGEEEKDKKKSSPGGYRIGGAAHPPEPTVRS